VDANANLVLQGKRFRSKIVRYGSPA
jgi:hypothetical protein